MADFPGALTQNGSKRVVLLAEWFAIEKAWAKTM